MIVDKILEKKFFLKTCDSLILTRFKNLSKQIQNNNFLNVLDPKSLLDIAEATESKLVKKEVYEIFLKRLSEHKLILDETIQERFNKLSNFVYDNNIFKLIKDIYEKSERKRTSSSVDSRKVSNKKYKSENNNIQKGHGVSTDSVKRNNFCEKYFINDVVFLESAFKNRIITFAIKNKNESMLCIASFLSS
ncbi:MAG TPA: hypothetical protein DDZ41_00800, partial [Flavobacterium sp.]|nr:hypothetical protein [Flavobacterium sp.]